MKIEITCPYCQFSKEVSREAIPQGSRKAICPRCQQRFEVSVPGEEIRLEGDGSAGGGTLFLRERSSWEKRSELGLWQAIFQTVKEVLFSPEIFFRKLTFRGGIGEPLAFGLLFGSVGAMFGFFWQFLLFSGGTASFKGLSFFHTTTGIGFMLGIILVPVLVAITIFIYSSIFHLLLLVVRGGKNGFEATLRVVSYSQAGQVWSLIPIVGGWIGGIWQLIVQIIGFKEIQDTSYARVIIAFLIPLAIIIILVLAVVAPLVLTFLHQISAQPWF